MVRGGARAHPLAGTVGMAQRVHEVVERAALRRADVAPQGGAANRERAPRLASMHPSVAGTAGSTRSAAVASRSR